MTPNTRKFRRSTLSQAAAMALAAISLAPVVASAQACGSAGPYDITTTTTDICALTGGATLNLTGSIGTLTAAAGSTVNITGSAAFSKATLTNASMVLNGTLNNVNGLIAAAGASPITVNGTWTRSSIFAIGTGTGALTVTNGGTLSYTGATSTFTGTGGLIVANGGTLKVAAGTTLTLGASTPLTVNNTGAIEIGVSSDTTYGKIALAADTNATLNGTTNITVHVVGSPTLTGGTELTDVILTSGTGTVSDVTGFTVTDDSADYDFTLTRVGTTSLRLTIAALGAATVPAQTITPAKRPLMTTGVTQTIFSTLKSGNQVIQSVNTGDLGLNGGDGFEGDKNFWVKPMGSAAKQKDNSNVSGYEANGWGLMMGGDRLLAPKVRAGLAVGYAQNTVKSNRSLATHDAVVDGYRLIGYGGYNISDRTDLSWQVDAGTSQIKGTRVLTGAVASSDYTNTNYHLGLGLGKIFAVGEKTTFTPSVRADYTNAVDSGYTETGAGASNLTVKSNTTEEMLLSVEGKLNHTFSPSTTGFVSLGGGYDMAAKRASLTSNTASGVV